MTKASESAGSPALRQRALWRSRRGMLELELLLLPFVRDAFADLPPPAQAAYHRLLEFDDWDVFDWLQGRAAVPEDDADPAIVDIIARIRRFHADRSGGDD